MVHTLPEPPLPVSSPTGWQIPLGQSEFLLHGVPVPFEGGVPASPLPASPGVVASKPASCGAEPSDAASAPLELPLASATPTHTAPSQVNPAAQL